MIFAMPSKFFFPLCPDLTNTSCIILKSVRPKKRTPAPPGLEQEEQGNRLAGLAIELYDLGRVFKGWLNL